MSPSSILEIVWTLLSLFGSATALYNLQDSTKDLRVIKRAKVNGLRKMVAKSNIRQEAVRSACLIIFAIMGFAAIAAPNDNGSESQTTAEAVFGILFLSGLIAVNLLLVYNTVADRLHRRRVFNYIEPRDNRLVSIPDDSQRK